jgi:hypothetical protein
MNHAAIFFNRKFRIGRFKIDEERNQKESTRKESCCRQEEVAEAASEGMSICNHEAPVNGAFFCAMRKRTP